jgi:CheY-like chemotaxis protein
MSDFGIVLLVEDRSDDVELIRHAFRRAGISSPLHVVRDGDLAMAYLSGTGVYANRDEHPLPDLILLDLKMPGTDGFEVLQWLRQQSGFSTIPVIVLTSSEQMRDVNQAYELGANSFLVKPFDFQDLVSLSQTLKTFWLQRNKKPESQRPTNKPNGKH